MQELVPLLSGFGVGLAVGAFGLSLPRWAGVLLVVILGVLATVLTGEFKVSWAFVLVDIPLVAVAALCGLAVARQAARRRLGTS